MGRNLGGARSVTQRTVILAGAPHDASVAMTATIVPAVARASAPARGAYADAVGRHFEAASEYGRWDLTLSCVESLTHAAANTDTRFGLMFTATTPPPAGVYRLTSVTALGVPDAQLFVAGPERTRSRASRHLAGRRP